MLRLVLDTNVVLDIFYWRNAIAQPLLAADESGAAIFVTDARCLAEFAHVLRQSPFALDDASACKLVDRYRALVVLAQPFTLPAELAVLPRCKDPDDQKFLELARDAQADLLVTRDKALLTLARRKFALRRFRIVAPAQAVAMLLDARGSRRISPACDGRASVPGRSPPA